VRETIAGFKTETVHRENGVIFNLDARKVMFSAGNLKERMRMSLFGKDEFVVDMFAGIGYFTLQMAVHSRPRKIMAIEMNPKRLPISLPEYPGKTTSRILWSQFWATAQR